MKFMMSLVFLLSTAVYPTAHASENLSNGGSWYLNYDWFNQIVNKTPAAEGQCPTLDVDVNNAGYKVSLQTSFYGSVSASISKWFPKDEIWSSIAIGPMVNKFGLIFADINSLNELGKQHSKKLPTTASELSKWNAKDSAYWESQGGISFYAGIGADPVSIGAFVVATGGWANYLEKTGPDTVYVERAKKQVKAITVGGGVGPINVGMDRVVESAKGFNYEFNVTNSASAEAFERFMAGDTTKAFELSKLQGSGVKKLADTSFSKLGKAFGMSIATPYIPIISWRASDGKDFNHEEEISVWDERVVKDYGFYTRQQSSRILGWHKKQNTSFKGGMEIFESGANENKQSSTKYYGTFKYAYQSDYGPESKLARYVDYAREISGLENEPETCVRIPGLRHKLGYNQVLLEMKLSDPYMRELIGIGTEGSTTLAEVEALAMKYDNQARANEGCNTSFEPNDTRNSLICNATPVSSAFATIKKSLRQINANLNGSKSEFAFAMAKFGKAVWSNPNIFKAIYQKGKECGVEMSFEVSGLRVSRFHRTSKFAYNDSCGVK